MLQLLEVFPPSNKEQSLPPFAGEGFVHDLVCVPPPQVLLHELHADQPPSTLSREPEIVKVTDPSQKIPTASIRSI